MDSIWWTALFVYLVVLVIDFIWMTKVDSSNGEKSSFARDSVNFIESALWPIILPLEIIFFIIIMVFEGVLKLLLLIDSLMRKLYGR